MTAALRVSTGVRQQLLSGKHKKILYTMFCAKTDNNIGFKMQYYTITIVKYANFSYAHQGNYCSGVSHSSSLITDALNY